MSNHILHPYLRDTHIRGYKECISCKSKTQSTCVKCGFCYNCHTELLMKLSSNQQQRKALDVYGQEAEPICNYRTCHHKFSVHGHKCKCRHALNYAAGVSMSRDYMIRD
jgi:hypothetical protein